MDKGNHSTSIALEHWTPYFYRGVRVLPIVTILFKKLNNKYNLPEFKVPRHHPFAYYLYIGFLKKLWKLCPLWINPLCITVSGKLLFGTLWKSLGGSISIGSIN
jgi:hypothetical protein